ncbi:hypothetical protein [Amycolatopsis sp. YIM 10]|uniref:hypothetical protein n=1 Tax=Amycolatopsis sp. YIM 10 TaxID=2653857 RepID=UPI00128FEDE5|nr:hypothetical protein [Amycolatopsis sp. YIM 10]QFU91240.1 hypothetical protein YIM_30370 [Amycolatopsis sp. YIM 10]
MTTPSGEGSGAGGTDGGSSGAPATTEAPAPEKPSGSTESSGGTSAATPESNPTPDKPADDSADKASGSTSEPAPPSDPAGEGADTTANQEQSTAGAPPAGPDSSDDPASGEAAGDDAPAEGSEEDVPGTMPGAEMKEVNNEDTRPRPGDEGFIGPVAPEDRQQDPEAGSLDSIIQQLQGTKRDAEDAHSEGDRGSRDVVDAWLDPNQDPARDRTGRTLDDTKGVGDSADALGQQVGRTQEQINAALRTIEESDRDAGSVDLLRPLLGAGESDVVNQRTQDMAAAERDRIANLTAEQIRNDPGWEGIEGGAAPASLAGNPEAIASADVLANAGAGVGGWQAAQSAARKADWWSGIASQAREYLPNSDVQRHVSLHGQVGRGEANAHLFSNAGKVANAASKFGGPVLGLPLAGLAIDNDIAAGETPAQAWASNGAGWGAGALTGLAIGASVGGPIGAVLGAIGGAAAGAVASGAVDNLFEHGSVVAPDDYQSPQA